MQALIEIHCRTQRELLDHLNVIRQQVKQALRAHSMTEVPALPERGIFLHDSNNYGHHSVDIREENE